MANKFNFDKVLSKFKHIDLSLDMANTAKNEFMNNFREQGFNGSKWQSRKNNKDSGRNILIGKGRKGATGGKLRRDVANSVTTGHKNSNLSYTLIVENEYARVHNEGLKSGRGSGFIMPKRQFVGMTSKLNAKILQKINQKVKIIWGT